MISTPSKRANEEPSTVEVEAKKRKGFGYSISSRLWLCKKLEFQKGSFTAFDEILKIFSSEEETKKLSRISLGRIIHDVWGKDVKFTKRGRRGEKRMTGYLNLGKKSEANECRIESTDDKKAEFESLSSVVLPKWTIVHDSSTSLSFVRNEGIAFENQRVSTEISVDSHLTLGVISRGFKLPLADLGLDKVLEGLSVSSKVRLLANLFDSSHLCTGILFDDEIAERAQLPGRTIHQVSRLPNTSQTAEKRMFSDKCNVFASSKDGYCPNCASLKRNEMKRIQRKSKSGEIGKDYCYINERYMSPQQLATKLCDQRKELLKNRRTVKLLELETETSD